MVNKHNKITKYLLYLILFLDVNLNIRAQSYNSIKLGGISLEYNTAVVLHNVKVYVDLDWLKYRYLILGFQSGIEFIHGISVEHTIYDGSPYYDLNCLATAHLFYDEDISIKPFIGITARYKSEAINSLYDFDMKYGATIQLNISKPFKIILKAMNVSIKNTDGLPIVFGIGFIIDFY
jgi:hypothetical protein